MTVLGEVHQLADGAVTPNTPDSGVHLYTANGLPAFVSGSGQTMTVPGAQVSFFPANTVTAASLTNLAQGTYTGGDAVTGAIYETEVWGSGTQGSTQQTLQFAVVWGGTTMSSVTLGALYMSIGLTFRWRAAARVICRSTGAGATWTSLLTGELSANTNTLLTSGSSSANATNGFIHCESLADGTTTMDSTVNQTLGVSAAWGSTTGAPTLTSQVALFKRIC